MWGRSVWLTVVVSGAMAVLASGCTGDGVTDSAGADPAPTANGPATGADPSRPTQPSPQPGWVVTLGDSYISGEGARWGANSSGPARPIDALGPDAYFDHNGQESEPGCHRASRTVVMRRLGDLRGKNLACSGATTRSDSSGVRFKPGLDSARETDGDGIGQVAGLRRFAASHQVDVVVVSIGGNDFGFGALAGRCVSNNLSWSGTSALPLCSDDPDLVARFGTADQARVERALMAALRRLTTAMRQAGYGRDDYRRILQTYPSPVPPGGSIRSSDVERGALGCPLFAADATWADSVALPAIDDTVARAARATAVPFEVLDLRSAFEGHRLCERGTSRLSETSLRDWDAATAVDQVEWVNQVYTTVAPHQIQESLHPNFWGVAAERACLRMVLTGQPRPAYRCTQAGPGLRDGDPVMELIG